MSFGFDDSDNTVEITHEAGDAVMASQLFIRGSGFTDAEGADQVIEGPWRGSSSDDGMITAGDSVTIGAESDYEIDVVWQTTQRDAGTTLASDRGPDR